MKTEIAPSMAADRAKALADDPRSLFGGGEQLEKWAAEAVSFLREIAAGLRVSEAKPKAPGLAERLLADPYRWSKGWCSECGHVQEDGTHEERCPYYLAALLQAAERERDTLRANRAALAHGEKAALELMAIEKQRAEAADARAKGLEGIVAVVQYRGKLLETSPQPWTTMAAFDSEDVAQRYAEQCGKGDPPWEYRHAVLTPATSSGERGEKTDGD